MYTRRQGRITRGQAAALERHLEAYRLDAREPFDAVQAFGRSGPIALEVGFGMGQGLLDFARANPAFNCIGAEVYRPGIGSLLAGLVREEITNVRIYEGDARALVAGLPAECLTKVMVYFPDPWPKKRHHKRRLIEPGFVSSLARVLEIRGELSAATDWEDYAHQMLGVFDAEPALVNASGPGNFAPRPASRPLTRFEQRGIRLGHPVWDLIYTKAPTTESR